MNHKLKILPNYLDDIRSNVKTFEIRFKDRDYKVGDTLILYGYENGHFINGLEIVDVVYLLDDEKFCKENFVVMSIERMNPYFYKYIAILLENFTPRELKEIRESEIDS